MVIALSNKNQYEYVRVQCRTQKNSLLHALLCSKWHIAELLLRVGLAHASKMYQIFMHL